MTPKTKVFLIDDDNIFVMLTNKIIAGSGTDTEVTVFNDGKSAIDFIENNMNNTELLPDIILLDLNMPVMDGWGFMDEFAILLPFLRKIPTVNILSSSMAPHDLQRMSGIPYIDDYIVKPLTRTKFIDLVSNQEICCSRFSDMGVLML